MRKIKKSVSLILKIRKKIVLWNLNYHKFVPYNKNHITLFRNAKNNLKTNRILFYTEKSIFFSVMQSYKLRKNEF